MIKESGIDKEYFVIKKDNDGVIVLRKWLLGARRMNPQNTTNYDGCEMDTWLLNDTDGFKSTLSAATKECLVARSINWHRYTDTEVSTILRDVFLLSLKETTNSQAQSLEPEEYLGELIKHKNGGSLKAYMKEATDASTWWLRSPSSATYYYYINASGSSGYNSALNSYCVRPALNLSVNTDVALDPATGMYYLDVEEHLYGEIEYKMEVGSTSNRPKKVRVVFEDSGIYDTSIEVCNNYEDGEPVWVTTDVNGYAVLTNTVKGTDEWKIGVHVTCKTNTKGIGYIKEPVVIVEEE